MDVQKWGNICVTLTVKCHVKLNWVQDVTNGHMPVLSPGLLRVVKKQPVVMI